jgi:hypothetical protein
MAGAEPFIGAVVFPARGSRDRNKAILLVSIAYVLSTMFLKSERLYIALLFPFDNSQLT